VVYKPLRSRLSRSPCLHYHRMADGAIPAPSRQSWPAIQPPVTVLKPLCGAEHGLYESLRTFCDQPLSAISDCLCVPMR